MPIVAEQLVEKIRTLTPERQERVAALVEALVDDEQRYRSAIAEGLADIEAGRVISDEQLKAELETEYGPLEA